MSNDKISKAASMRPTTEAAIMKLLQSEVFKTGKWSCVTQKDPVMLGDYGRRELYMWEGRPVFRLEISFNPPRTKAFKADL